MRYYSPSTGATYLSKIHSDIPGDAVEISEERFLEVVASPPAGKIRSHDAGGLPILIDPPKVELTAEELAATERAWRDAEVSSTEWLVTRHRDELDMQRPTKLTTEQFAKLLAYRQELRDWPLALQFPSPAGRPLVPPWIAEQTQ
ncbi:phage tail assembly chaperone [Pseudomonas aegrilactucae]|uniref:Phage tail assembly chaperone n=1 Tax=Pseudomonas aegrilactucae TaxID=2854028 RepID=A0A9Q2XKQ5_9PSED|nr:phage tail assembly chaperone [Pseudomonas aegrilactucae]MBV6288531.1 phage tail assembly chaperone [Pseudomonas aegrilactucae]